MLPYAMFGGEKINRTEDRAVLHTALRSLDDKEIILDGKNIVPLVRVQKEKMRTFSTAIRQGVWRGANGNPITDVVNIGIGGSDLGPQMVTEALRPYVTPKLRLHFVSNIDGAHLASTLDCLAPETTLFIVASKTFSTLETMMNAHSARRWLVDALGEDAVGKHFVALSTNVEEVSAFGIDSANMFEFWDWVGGRYSLWSVIGLSIAIAIGMDAFEEMLRGAASADEHFRTQPFEKNIPVLMGLVGIWNRNFFGTTTQAIVPYDQSLHRFAAYLQQADMESNGKSVDRDGQPITDYATGPVIWGEPGTNGQHAFFQLIHQGTDIVPVDFLVALRSHHTLSEHHRWLVANCFAQSQALMLGKDTEVAELELLQNGVPYEQASWLAHFQTFEGNRPSNTLVFDQLTPYTLGQLIALYEHKIFVQGVLWNVFSFDQWGVQLGKVLAKEIAPSLDVRKPLDVSSFDSSTTQLIERFRAARDE